MSIYRGAITAADRVLVSYCPLLTRSRARFRRSADFKPESDVTA